MLEEKIENMSDEEDGERVIICWMRRRMRVKLCWMRRRERVKELSPGGRDQPWLPGARHGAHIQVKPILMSNLSDEIIFGAMQLTFPSLCIYKAFHLTLVCKKNSCVKSFLLHFEDLCDNLAS